MVRSAATPRVSNHEARRVAARMTMRLLIDERGELRTLVGDEYRDQFRRLGSAGVRRDQVGRARRLKERLPHLERLDRAAAKLRADFAPGDVGGDRTGMAMRAGKSARAIEYTHDDDTLARHIRQRIGGDRLDDIRRRP